MRPFGTPGLSRARRWCGSPFEGAVTAGTGLETVPRPLPAIHETGARFRIDLPGTRRQARAFGHDLQLGCEGGAGFLKGKTPGMHNPGPGRLMRWAKATTLPAWRMLHSISWR